MKIAQDERWMRAALEQARAAGVVDEVPIGAILVVGGDVVAAGHNRRELEQDPTLHAEIVVLRAAAHRRGGWRLQDATMYVTVEPCPMCAGALVMARLKRVVYGAHDTAYGACGSLLNLADYPGMPHHVEVTGGVLEEPCRALLQDFFARQRNRGVAPSPNWRDG